MQEFMIRNKLIHKFYLYYERVDPARFDNETVESFRDALLELCASGNCFRFNLVPNLQTWQ